MELPLRSLPSLPSVDNSTPSNNASLSQNPSDTLKVMRELVDASTLKPEIVEGVDIMVVRELTGDVYFGTPKVRI